MRLGFEFVAEKIAQPEQSTDAPSQTPMKAGHKELRNPTTDQKKVRRQLTKKQSFQESLTDSRMLDTMVFMTSSIQSESAADNAYWYVDFWSNTTGTGRASGSDYGIPTLEEAEASAKKLEDGGYRFSRIYRVEPNSSATDETLVASYSYARGSLTRINAKIATSADRDENRFSDSDRTKYKARIDEQIGEGQTDSETLFRSALNSIGLGTNDSRDSEQAEVRAAVDAALSKKESAKKTAGVADMTPAEKVKHWEDLAAGRIANPLNIPVDQAKALAEQCRAELPKESKKTADGGLLGGILAIPSGGKAEFEGEGRSFTVYYDEEQAYGDMGGRAEGMTSGNYELVDNQRGAYGTKILTVPKSPTADKGYAANIIKDRIIKEMHSSKMDRLYGQGSKVS